MNNREKALELVQKCLDDWPYAATMVDDIMNRLKQVKTLLKEQEAKKVIAEKRKTLIDDSYDEARYCEDTFYHCPSCNRNLSRTHMNKDIHFCSSCGQAVKWE